MGVSYLTTSDLVARFGAAQLAMIADRDNDGAADEPVLARAIDDAGSVVDLFVRGRYALPLSPVDPAIAVIVGDLARRNLYGDATVSIHAPVKGRPPAPAAGGRRVL